MKLRLLITMAIIYLFCGCMTSVYRPAEQKLERKEYYKAIRAYLKLVKPHKRLGRRYIYYEKEAVTGIGIVYWTMQKYDVAQKILQVVIEKDPNWGKALFYLGMSFEGQGKDEEAIQAYMRYHNIPLYDPYRQVIRGRFDHVLLNKNVRDLQLADQNIDQVQVTSLPQKSVAIFYFMNLSEDPEWNPLQVGLTEMIIQDLSKIDEIRVIDRSKLNTLMEDLQINISELSNEEIAIQVAKRLQVRNLVQGSFLVTSDLRLTLSAQIFEVGMMDFPTPMDFDGTLSRLFKMEKEIVLRITDYLGVDLTIQERDRILEIPTENMMAFMHFCRGLEAMDYGNFEEAQDYFKTSQKYDADFDLAKDWIITPEIWYATHSRNLFRVNYEISRLIRTSRGGQSKMVFKRVPELVSSWNRLQWMGIKQNAGLLPGSDTRISFQEVDLLGVPVVPQILSEPPPPPTQ